MKSCFVQGDTYTVCHWLTKAGNLPYIGLGTLKASYYTTDDRNMGSTSVGDAWILQSYIITQCNDTPGEVTKTWSKRKFLPRQKSNFKQTTSQCEITPSGIIKLENPSSSMCQAWVGLSMWLRSVCAIVRAHAHACFQVLWLRGNHMQARLTHWDGVPVL